MSPGSVYGRCVFPPRLNLPCGLVPRSNISPSMSEWATLPENSLICVRRGQVFAAISVPSNLPVGCSGKAIQKPVASEPADTFPRYVLSGFVIQKVDAVLSEGIN